MVHTLRTRFPAAINRCIDACARCHQVCVDAVAYCLEMGGEHAARAHAVFLLDCAQICRTTEDFMVRGSRLHNRACSACAEVCDACAAECEAFANDPHMEACADACRNCADACRQASATSMEMTRRAPASTTKKRP